MYHFTMNLFLLLTTMLLVVPPSFGNETAPLVLFDQGHNQRFVIEEKGELQLSGLADTIRAQGARVAATKAPLTDEALNGIAALVISGPFEQLRPEEVEAVARFLKKGGRLAAMLHIGSPLAGLLARLDVDCSNAVLHERRNILGNDLNFRVKALSPSPLFNGISEFSAYGVWALNAGASSTVIAHTSPEAWVDLNGDGVLSNGDAVGAFGLVVSGTLGAGSFVIFGDDAIFQNRYLDENNKKLATNLGSWLTKR
jgi:hypothetical protein